MNEQQSPSAAKPCPNSSLQAYLTALTRKVDAALRVCLSHEQKPGIPPRLSAAINYSLQGRGKRIRPLLCLVSARLCYALASPDPSENHCGQSNEPGKPAESGEFGADALWKQMLPFALALEMIHTYSLIHDDLPALDNDDLRRGRPSCHKAYDEATAILAGDGLLTEAFAFMCQTDLPAERVLLAVRIVAEAAGSTGMVGGQMLDMEATRTQPSFQDIPVSVENLTALSQKKTAALLRAACEAGAVLAGASPELCAHMRAYGTALGMAYQMTDDILDEVGNTVTLGKTAGSDKQQGKWTWTALLGLEECEKQARNFCNVAEEALNAACAQALTLSVPSPFGLGTPQPAKKLAVTEGDKGTDLVINQDMALLRHLAQALVYRSF